MVGALARHPSALPSAGQGLWRRCHLPSAPPRPASCLEVCRSLSLNSYVRLDRGLGGRGDAWALVACLDALPGGLLRANHEGLILLTLPYRHRTRCSNTSSSSRS